MPSLGFQRARAKSSGSRERLPRDPGKRLLSSLPSPPSSKRRVGRKRGYKSADKTGRGGKERLASESGAYISAGTNCPIIHSVRRQRCSSAYPRPLLLPPSASFAANAGWLLLRVLLHVGEKKSIDQSFFQTLIILNIYRQLSVFEIYCIYLSLSDHL